MLSHELLCEGRTISITKNADSLFRHFRKRHKSHRIWLDAVCINQQDTEEKDDQIRLMGQIFQCATRVHIWLGEATESAEVAFALLRGIIVLKAQNSSIRQRNDQKKESTASSERDLPDISVENVGAIVKLLSRPWFNRRWILQEIGVSYNATFHCGHLPISLSIFKEAVGRLEASKL